ncbi:MAG TPA: hypothetical protein PKC44_12125 [Agitococcus sp.]|nr:hypothetical protein [Agitococcus sp.]
MKVLFVAASDTLVRLLAPIFDEALLRGCDVYWATLPNTYEMAEFEIACLYKKSQYVGVLKDSVIEQKYDFYIFGNDWSNEAKTFIERIRKQKIGITVVIQESIVNFLGAEKRLCWCDCAFVQGNITAEILVNANRSNVFSVGNPRYENIKKTKKDKNSRIIINSNFTYGVGDSYKWQWLKDTVNASKKVSSDVVIIQHPRDNQDLSILGVEVIKTNAAVVHSKIQEAALLITRASSLIHEALAMDRPVLFYNPANEDYGYDFGKIDGFFHTVTNDGLLEQQIRLLLSNKVDVTLVDSYLKQHIYPHHERASVLIVDKLVAINQDPERYRLPLVRDFNVKRMLKMCLGLS